jgi:Repeat of unknown function (DUF346)
MSTGEQGDAATRAWLDSRRTSGRVTKSLVATALAAGLMVLLYVACAASIASADVYQTGALEKISSPITSKPGEIKPLASSANGDYKCLYPYSVIANWYYYFSIGNCREGWILEVVSYASENSQTHEHSYGGFVGSAFSGCGWIDTRFPLEKVNNNTNSACAGGGSSREFKVEESSFMERYDTKNAAHDGTYVVNPLPCPEYANYRPWSTNNVEKELIRTAPAYATVGSRTPALKWRYTTKYSSTDSTGQYVMVRDARITGAGEGNWVFVPRSCLSSPLPENEGEAINPPPPTVTTDAPSGVGTTNATLHAEVNPQGVDTKYFFEYGTTESYGSYTTTEDAGAGESIVHVQAPIGGLAPGTTYYYRIVASSAIGEVFGGPVGFTTQAPPPTVTTSAALGVQLTRVTLNGTVNANGVDTHYHFEYGPTTSYGSSTTEGDAGSGTSAVQESYTVTGLVPGATYHYRLVATSVGGTIPGSDVAVTLFGTTGDFTETLSSVAQSNGNVDVFGRLSNGHLGHIWYTSGYWNGPQDLGGSVASEPSAVLAGGHVQVFWKGTDGNLWTGIEESPGQWSGATSLGDGTLGSAPHAIGQSNGTIDVFWGGGGGQLYHDFTTGGAWHGWEAKGGAVASDPSPVLIGGGHYAVFWKGTDGNLWEGKWEGGSWIGPTNRGDGTLGGGPHAIGQSNGTIDVFWSGGSGSQLYHDYTGGGGAWHGWEAEGGALSSEPSPVLTGSGHYAVFWKGTDGNLREGKWEGGSWEGNINLGSGPLGPPPVATSAENRNINVFWGATDRSGVWSDWYTPTNGWAGPENLTPPPPPPSVTSGSTLGVQRTRVALNGSVNPNGYATTYQFEYGPTTSYGTKVPASEGSAGSGTSSVQESYTITGLTPGATYHYRLVARSAGGTTSGSDVAVTLFSTTGDFTETLSSVAQSNGNVDVFGRLSNGDLGHLWFTGGYWNGPQDLGGGVASETSTVLAGGHVQVFWKGTDGNLWTGISETPGQWGGAKSLGDGTLGGAPHAIGQSNGTIDVFWSNATGGQLYHDFTTGSGWHGWEAMGGELASAPSPVLTGSGHYSVFWKGTDGNLREGKYEGGSWQGNINLGNGTLGGGPHAIGQSNGTVDVFWGNPTGGQLYHVYGSGSSFSSWEGLGGALASEPSPVLTGSGHYAVFWKGSEGNLREGKWEGVSWEGNINLGSGTLGPPPTAVSAENGKINVFWGATDRPGVWSDWYSPTNGWAGPENLGQ